LTTVATLYHVFVTPVESSTAAISGGFGSEPRILNVSGTILPTALDYYGAMDKDDHLERHLELCHRIYLRMLADGSWSWRDSPKSEDLVESEDEPDIE
jgi:hypothetical protein